MEIYRSFFFTHLVTLQRSKHIGLVKLSFSQRLKGPQIFTKGFQIYFATSFPVSYFNFGAEIHKEEVI